MSFLTTNQQKNSLAAHLLLTINNFSADDDVNVDDWFVDFEYVAKILGWNNVEMYNAIPVYLQGTAKRWYTSIFDVSSETNNIPKDYTSLKSKMIADLCSSDYKLYLAQKLHGSYQRIGQSSTAFIYEIYELCNRIYEQMPAILIVSLAKEKLLPQIKYAVELKNPKTLDQLLNAAKLAERAMYSCANPFDTPNQEIVTLQTEIQQMERKLDRFNEYSKRTNFLH